MTPKPIDNTYHIAFDTKEMPGLIVAVKVTLSNEVLRTDDTKYRVDLCCHPLYEQLCTYVMHNKPRGNRHASDTE